MALTKEIKIIGIAIVEDKVKVSNRTIVKENGKIIVTKDEYYLLSKEKNGNLPDISNEDEKVQAVCNIAWS